MHYALISFLNARPLWWGLVHPQHSALSTEHSAVDTFEFTSPARCADLLAAGAADLGLIPAIEIARIPDLVVVPRLCIASRTEVRSVLLLSRVPIEEVRSVALDPSSRTSIALARILLGERLGDEIYRRIRFNPVESSSLLDFAGHDSAVVIGDLALRAMSLPSSERLFRYDLVSEWSTLFGEPFVFALWAGNRQRLAAYNADDILAVLVESRNQGMANLDRIIDEAVEEVGMTRQELDEYFTRALHYDFGEPEASALARFYRLARKYQLIEEVRDIQWLRSSAPHAIASKPAPSTKS